MLQLFRLDGGSGGTFNICVQLLVPRGSTEPKTNSPILMLSFLVLLWGFVTVKVSSCNRLTSNHVLTENQSSKLFKKMRKNSILSTTAIAF
jgi:hypothetical protein